MGVLSILLCLFVYRTETFYSDNIQDFASIRINLTLEYVGYTLIWLSGSCFPSVVGQLLCYQLTKARMTRHSKIYTTVSCARAVKSLWAPPQNGALSAEFKIILCHAQYAHPIVSRYLADHNPCVRWRDAQFTQSKGIQCSSSLTCSFITTHSDWLFLSSGQW